MKLLEKISNHYKEKAQEDPAKRFERQLKGSFISTAIIIGVVFVLIIIIFLWNALSSIFN